MKASSYMYFVHNKRRVPLYNSNDYSVDLGNGSFLSTPPCNEILLLEYLNYPTNPEFSKRNIHQWLTNSYNNFPYHLQEVFIKNFIKDHPVEISNTEEIPIHAINGLYSFCVPTLGETVTITEEQEKELVDIINKCKHASKKHVIQWFTKYYYDRGENPFIIYDNVKKTAIEFITAKGYIAYQGVNIEGVLTGVAVIWKVLISIVAAIILIGLIFSALRVVFS